MPSSGKIKHGLSKHPLYAIWTVMKQRCLSPKCKMFPRYGGRGITIYKIWMVSFIQFYTWCIENRWERGLSIDRIDNDK
jgi:hypothetical protein